MMNPHPQQALHLIPRTGDRWAVRWRGGQRALRVFHKRADAFRYAEDKAARNRARLYIHLRNGVVAEVRQYGPGNVVIGAVTTAGGE